MSKKTFRSIFLLITYSILLVAVLLKIDYVLVFLTKIIYILKPIGIAIAFAFIINRPYKFFIRLFLKIATKKVRLAKLLAILVSYLFVISVISGIVAFLIPELTQSARRLYENVDTYSERVQDFINRNLAYFNLEEISFSNLELIFEKLPDIMNNAPKGVFPFIYDTTTSLFRIVMNVFLGFVLSIYLISDKDRLLSQMNNLIKVYCPKAFGEKMMEILRVANKTFVGFVTGQFTEALILGGLCFLGMLIFGFEYALLISIIIAITSLIPIVGPIIGFIPSVFILLMTDPVDALWFMIFIIVLQQLEGDLIYPKVVGESIGLPALWVLLAIIIGGGLFGIIGMLLGVPVTSVIYQLVSKDVKQRMD